MTDPDRIFDDDFPPGEENLLYVNPGSFLELALPGETVLEIVGSMADTLDDTTATARLPPRRGEGRGAARS